MKHAISYALSGVFLVALAVPLHAADAVVPVEQVVIDNGSGFYIGSLSNVNFLDDTSFDLGGGAIGVDNNYDVGFYGALRAGYNFGRMSFISPRLELEIGYGNSSIDTHSVNGTEIDSIDSFGDARSIQGFVNGYLDIPLAGSGQGGFLSAVVPYLGGGAGFMNLELRKQGVSAVGTVMDDDDTQFAYHFDAGLGIQLQNVFTGTTLFDKTTLEIGYRYTGTSDFDFTARDGTTSSTDFTSNAITLGFRKQF